MVAALLVGCIAGAISLVRSLIPYMPFTRNHLGHSVSTTVDLPVEIAWEALDKYLMALKCSERTDSPGVRTYQRGLMKMHKVEQIIPLYLIPHVIALGMKFENGCTQVHILYGAIPSVAFSDAAAEFFLDSVKAEADGAIELLRRIADDEAVKQSQQQHRSPQTDHQLLSDDFESLGLNPKATWAEVQSSYRESCQKFHPDHLAGQQVSPHLADLSNQRFKECTAAYQRLKQRMA
ncbi:MAG: DnaJ domain-containing protein [Phycisphaerae bacterium]|nr:DnaJ domain-containing protein [Phycisphaerae bacterium]